MEKTVYNCDVLDLINVIATSLGAIVTTCSLIYLFISDYKKGKRISNLERVAEALEKDMLLKYQPHLWLNGVSMRSAENRLNFDLNNKREWCRLIEFNIISGDLVLDQQNLHLPSELEPRFNEAILDDTTRRYVFAFNYSGKPQNEVEYQIEIIYEDRLNNRYSVQIKGVGGNCKLTSPIRK
jgi:hypothetical protein